MHPIGFLGCLFYTIIFHIGRRSVVFFGEIILSSDWFSVREKYLKLFQFLHSSYFLVHCPVDGCLVVHHYFYQVSFWLLFPTLVDICPTMNTHTLPIHLSIQIFDVSLITKLFSFFLFFISFYFLYIHRFLMGLLPSWRHLGLGKTTFFMSSHSFEWPPISNPTYSKLR